MVNTQTLLQSLDHLVRLPQGTLKGPEPLNDLDGWDSLAVIEYIALVDEQFGVDVAPDKIRKCKRVQDLVDLAAC